MRESCKITKFTQLFKKVNKKWKVNMILSMTGYAQLKASLLPGDVEAEVKSVNSRYLELNIRLPKILSNYEYSIREKIKENVTRGKLYINVNLVRLNPEFMDVSLNEDLMKSYYKLIKTIQTSLQLPDQIKLDHILVFRDIFDSKDQDKGNEKVENELIQFIGQLMEKHRESRRIEGENLQKDIFKRLMLVQEKLKSIKPLAQKNPEIEFKKQQERLFNLLNTKNFDENRLLQELAILADKVDVTEEIVRLESHIQLFENILKEEKPVGKKLNFLLQEFHRELNTMGVKTTLPEISHTVVEMKEEVEKIREQVQNIE